MCHSVNLLRTCGWRHLCLRRQIAVQDAPPLVRADHLPIRDVSREILNALRGYRPGGPQHGVCCRQNLITERRTQFQGRFIKCITEAFVDNENLLMLIKYM